MYISAQELKIMALKKELAAGMGAITSDLIKLAAKLVLVETKMHELTL